MTESPNPTPEPSPESTPTPTAASGADKKIIAGICGILVGYFGVHKFVLGYNKEGGIMLGVSLAGIILSCLVLPGLATMAMGIIGLIEGIMYLTKTDEEFVATYITGNKPWF